MSKSAKQYRQERDAALEENARLHSVVKEFIDAEKARRIALVAQPVPAGATPHQAVRPAADTVTLRVDGASLRNGDVLYTLERRETKTGNPEFKSGSVVFYADDQGTVHLPAAQIAKLQPA